MPFTIEFLEQLNLKSIDDVINFTLKCAESCGSILFEKQSMLINNVKDIHNYTNNCEMSAYTISRYIDRYQEQFIKTEPKFKIGDLVQCDFYDLRRELINKTGYISNVDYCEENRFSATEIDWIFPGWCYLIKTGSNEFFGWADEVNIKLK